MDQQGCKYTAPASNDKFIEEYTEFIKQIIYGFNWGGVKHVAYAQAEDLYQDLMLSWIVGSYLDVYDSTSHYLNPRTGKHVKCTFKNFVYQFTSRRLFNWRDQFNRQVYRIRTEAVIAEDKDEACDMEVNGIKYVYKKKFIRNIAMQEIIDSNDDRQFTFEDKHENPTKDIDDIDCLKSRCVAVHSKLKEMRVVSKRDYAKLFLCICRMSSEQGTGVLQTALADEFGVSASTISLMVKQMRSIPVVREFKSVVENDIIYK